MKKQIIFAPIYCSVLRESKTPFNFGNGVSLINFGSLLTTIDNTDTIIRFIGEDYCNQLHTIKYALKIEENYNSLLQRDRITEKILFVNNSLWIASLANFAYRYTFYATKSPLCLTIQNIIRHSDTVDSATKDVLLLSVKYLDEASKINKIISKIPRKGALWMAIRMLQKARENNDWETSFLFYWIIIESLFGSDNIKSELSHRIAERIVLFNKENYKDLKKSYKDIKLSYNWRSKIAHGKSLTYKSRKLTGSDSIKLISEIEVLIQYSLKKILMKRKYREIFQGDQREDFLDSLIFTSKS